VLIVRSSGKVSGDVTYGELEIERGGKIKGSMKQV
jgi:cytoskeletal protein CcmA (bactofilin family)